VANSPESERRGWAFALAAARRAGNARAVSELQAIAPYAAPGRRIALKDAMVVHKWGDYFGGVMAYRTSQEDESHAGRLSPDYSDAEAPHIYDGNAFSEHYLLADVFNLDLSGETRLATPLILLEGRHDRTVSSDVAHEWFEKVTAPEKRFVWFENSAHEPESEEPGKFLLSLIRYARPIAAKAGDVAP
jgi:pimeloyl-ACP methyl ester carboxylesterase